MLKKIDFSAINVLSLVARHRGHAVGKKLKANDDYGMKAGIRTGEITDVKLVPINLEASFLWKQTGSAN